MAYQTTTELIEDTQKNKYLTFLIEKDIYAIDIKHVIEIIGMQSITKIPDAPTYVMGIINLRGKIIPTIDVRIKFSKPTKEYDEKTCIIIIDIEDTMIGLIVDTVLEVLTIDEESMSVPPQYSKSNQFIKGVGQVGDTIALLLDCNML